MLSIFGHRFMAIAEQMGRSLQKTSVSTNVKERLDFSCAIFDAQGGLVANAPHIPVHLGSMSTCVRMQAELWKGKLQKGDVIISNHPSFGGTPRVSSPASDKLVLEWRNGFEWSRLDVDLGRLRASIVATENGAPDGVLVWTT